MSYQKNINPTDEKLHDIVFAQTVELSYKALLPSVYVNLVIAVTLVIVLRGVIADGMLFGWFLISAMVSVIRYVLFVLYHRDNNKYENTAYWDRLFFMALLLAGLSLSVVSLWLTPDITSIYHYFPVMILIGMGAGSVPALSFSMRNVFSYLCLVLIPVFISEMFVATYMSYSVATLSIVLIIFSTINAKRFNSMTIENIELNYKSEEHRKELIESKNSAIAANSAKTSFISLISHELRTPLNAILGFSQLLGMSDPKLNDEQEDQLQGIIGSGKHLLSLIEELLDLSRIESDKLQVDIHDVSLSDAIDESLLLLNTTAAKNKIKIINNIEQGYIIKADYKRLKQVILNLVSNGIKYNYEHGEVSLGISSSGNKVRISVADTGPGLTPEQQQELYQPFKRFNDTEEGIGLGLFITRKLVTLMHGDMGMETTFNNGSVFWFELPLVEKI